MRIAIEGPPGVGKSSLCRALAERVPGACVIEEPVLENLYLGDYYKNPDRWALSMQLDLLVQRALAACEFLNTENTQFFDRSLLGDRIFAKAVYRMGLMEDREYATYLKVFEALTLRVKIQPDCLVYLRAEPQVVYDRIRSRARPEETNGSGMSFDYLQRVWGEYEEFMSQDRDMPVLTLDWNEFQPTDAVLTVLEPYV